MIDRKKGWPSENFMSEERAKEVKSKTMDPIVRNIQPLYEGDPGFIPRDVIIGDNGSESTIFLKRGEDPKKAASGLERHINKMLKKMGNGREDLGGYISIVSERNTILMSVRQTYKNKNRTYTASPIEDLRIKKYLYFYLSNLL